MKSIFTNPYGEQFVVIRLNINNPIISLEHQAHYDFFIVNRVASIGADELESIASRLVLFKLGWVEVFGADAERLPRRH